MRESRQFFLLVRLLLRMRLGLSVLKASQRHNPNAFTRHVLIGVAVAFAVLTILGTYGFILFTIMLPAVLSGLGPVVLGLVFLISMVFVLVLGTLSMISLVWGAKDTELYAALPLTQRSVFLSKLFMVYLVELLSTLFFAVPAVILYAVHVPVPGWYWPACLLVIPLLPVIPMAVSALLSALLMRASALFRRRELFMVLGSFVLIGLIFLLQGQMNSFFATTAQDPDSIAGLLQDSAGLLRSVTGAFPPAAWAAGALTLNGLQALGSLALYLLTAAAGLFLTVQLGGRTFYRGALAQMETLRGPARGYKQDKVRVSSVVKSLYVREWRILLRTPVYALNGLSGVVILPLMLILLPLMGNSANSTKVVFDMLTQMKGTALLLILAGVMSFAAWVNPAATTAVSREGRQFWMGRTLPVPMHTQLLAKMLCAASLVLLGILLMVACLLIFMNLPPLMLLYAALIGLSLSVPVTMISMIPDVLKPKLNWNSEAEAMKQNFNSLIGMLLALVPILLGAALAIPLSIVLEPLYLTLVLVLLFAAMGVGSWQLLKWMARTHLDTREG